jgi:hypothetical protein
LQGDIGKTVGRHPKEFVPIRKRDGHPWDIVFVEAALDEVVDGVKRPLQTTQDRLLMNWLAPGCHSNHLFATTTLYLPIAFTGTLRNGAKHAYLRDLRYPEVSTTPPSNY